MHGTAITFSHFLHCYSNKVAKFVIGFVKAATMPLYEPLIMKTPLE